MSTIAKSDSILDSVKDAIGGISSSYTVFDDTIIMHINSVFDDLHQIGVGPAEGFAISDNTTTWNDYIDNPLIGRRVRSYVTMKVRMLFDPPTNGTVSEQINNSIKEMEWRLCSDFDNPTY